MTIQILADSHLDHGLSEAQINYLLHLFHDRDGFFVETVTLPENLGTVLCSLRGPVRGDPPIGSESPVSFQKRGQRSYESRMVAWEPTPTREVTVIAGPHEGHSCVLYTAFGGPVVPKEPRDPSFTPEERERSEQFWAVHALTG